MRPSPKTSSFDGLSDLSIAKAQKSVENLQSWEDAVAHTKVRIRELRHSLRVFQERARRGESWPGTQSDRHVTEPCQTV